MHRNAYRESYITVCPVVKMISNQSGDGHIAPLVFGLIDDSLSDGVIFKLKIPGLSPYPNIDGHV